MRRCLASGRSLHRRRWNDAPKATRAVQLAAVKRALPVVTAAPNTIKLPKTATDAELKMIAGSILLALGLILFVFNRRQAFAR